MAREWMGDGPMVAIVLSGNQGQKHVKPGVADLYDCKPDFRVDTKKTASTTQSGRVFIAKASPGAMWRGGYIHGMMSPEDEYSMYSKTGNGGAPFHVENVNEFLIEKLKIDGSCWDPIRIGSGVKKPRINKCLIIDARDDAIEADHSGFGTLTVQRSYFKNTHTYASTTPGKGGTPSPYKWVWEKCLLELTNNQRDSRDKRKYAWNPTNFGSGQPWKVQSQGVNGTFQINDCVLMWRRLPKQSLSNHRLIPTRMKLEPSKNNVFVWLGPQTKDGNGGVAVVKVPKIGGGTMVVPESVLGSGDERARILATYAFTDQEAFWNVAVKKWEVEEWGGTPPPEPDPEPDPEPEPEPTYTLEDRVEMLEERVTNLETEWGGDGR